MPVSLDVKARRGPSVRVSPGPSLPKAQATAGSAVVTPGPPRLPESVVPGQEFANC